ncbi:DUF7673 family protein [Pseudomonas lini]
MRHSKDTRKVGTFVEDKVLSAADMLERQKKWDRQLAEYENRRAAAEVAGIPALHRLIEVARRNTGQSRVCGRFLLAIYNSLAFPFNLTDLRRLDRSLWEDCISVLRLDQHPKKEIHLLIADGPAIWEELKGAWATDRPG